MLEKSENVFIDDKQPFLNCKLEREPIADNLTKIIEGIEGSFVFGINSPWGTGKSTFIKMWQKKLELEKTDEIFTIYFNAWENDFHGEVLLALVGELEKYLNTYLEKTNKDVTKKDLKKTASNIGNNIIKKITFDTVNLKELYKELDSTEERKLFNEYESYNQLKKSLQDNLTLLKKKLDVKKVIFFIDELDRCRPNYAVETLEKLKHLFDIEDYVFVLALDKEQLSHSVSTIYGEGMDSNGYLRRFIDFDYLLPKPNRLIYIDYLKDKFSLTAPHENDKYLWEFLYPLTDKYNFSLRDIDKLFYQLKILWPLIPNFSEGSYRYFFSYGYTINYLYIVLIVLKMYDTKEYHNLLSGNLENIKNIKPLKTWDNLETLHNEMIKGLSRLLKNPADIEGDYLIGEVFGLRERCDLRKLLDNTNQLSMKKTLDFIDDFK